MRKNLIKKAFKKLYTTVEGATNKYKSFCIFIFVLPLIPIVLIFNSLNLQENNKTINATEVEKIEKKQDVIKTDKPIIKQEQLSIERNTKEVSRGSEERIQQNTDIDFNMDLRTKSNLLAEQLDIILNNTGLQGLSQAYIDAEKNYNINAVFLVALSAQESGWGTSPLAKTKNNIFGFCAYDSDPNCATTFKLGKEECIDRVAKDISNNYLSENGCYHNGYTIASMNKLYASDPNWGHNIYKIMSNIINKINN